MTDKFDESFSPLTEGFVPAVSSEGSLLFDVPIEEMTVEEQVKTFLLIKFLADDIIKPRREALRKSLLQIAEEDGKPNAQGGHKMSVEGNWVKRERRLNKPDDNLVRDVLDRANVDHDKCFVSKTVTVLDHGKLDALVELGFIDQRDVDDTRKATYALQVFPSAEMEGNLREIEEAAYPRREVSLFDERKEKRKARITATGGDPTFKGVRNAG